MRLLVMSAVFVRLKTEYINSHAKSMDPDQTDTNRSTQFYTLNYEYVNTYKLSRL